MIIKFINKIFECSVLFLGCSLFLLGIEAGASELMKADSVIGEATKDVFFNFEIAKIQKNENWISQQFDLFLGDNLKDGQITKYTNNLKITRNRENYSVIYEVSIHDFDNGNVHGETTFYRGSKEESIKLTKPLSSGKTYVLIVRELDSWGTPNGYNYPIGFFSTDNGATAPIISKPEIDEVTDKDKVITGTATPNTTIYFTVGIDKYRGSVSENSKFVINLDKIYPAGTGIEAYTVDAKGNKSESAVTIVKALDIMLGVNPIYSSDSKITGKTMPNVLLEAAIDNSQESIRIFEGSSDEQGYFSIDMRGNTYPAGTQITITVFKPDGKKIVKQVIVYPRTPSVNTVHVGDRIITGVADPNAAIEVLVNNLDKYQTVVDAAGNFRVNVDELKLGDYFTVQQESNGIKSNVVVIEVR